MPDFHIKCPEESKLVKHCRSIDSKDWPDWKKNFFGGIAMRKCYITFDLSDRAEDTVGSAVLTLDEINCLRLIEIITFTLPLQQTPGFNFVSFNGDFLGRFELYDFRLPVEISGERPVKENGNVEFEELYIRANKYGLRFHICSDISLDVYTDYLTLDDLTEALKIIRGE